MQRNILLIVWRKNQKKKKKEMNDTSSVIKNKRINSLKFDIIRQMNICKKIPT